MKIPTAFAMALAAAVLAIAAASSCRAPGSSPRATAEAFLDAHYVRIDLERSKALARDLARHKISEEIELTNDVEIDAETRKPRITYKLRRADEAERAAQYAYELTIRAPGLDPFHKLVMVTVRRENGGWAVTNYSESDMPGTR